MDFRVIIGSAGSPIRLCPTVESDSTTDEEDGRKRPERKYYSDASDILERSP